MRIDPDAVYLELSEGVTVINHKTGATRHVPAVILHWKDGRKWRRTSFFGSDNNGDSVGAILARLGGWIDQEGGIVAALAEQDAVMSRGAS